MNNKKILIIGVSKGLGMVCAKALAEYDTTLVLMARCLVPMQKPDDSRNLINRYGRQKTEVERFVEKVGTIKELV